jgi:hypothetical protein
MLFYTVYDVVVGANVKSVCVLVVALVSVGSGVSGVYGMIIGMKNADRVHFRMIAET